MPTLHGLLAGAEKARDIQKFSDAEALTILAAFAWTFTDKPPLLRGEASRLQPYAVPERYVIRCESKLGTHEVGYYLLEAKATSETIAATLEAYACPQCGKQGQVTNRRQWALGNSKRWFTEYHCPDGHSWKRQDKF